MLRSRFRTTIRYCANAIRAVHRSDWKEPSALQRKRRDLREAEKGLSLFRNLLRRLPHGRAKGVRGGARHLRDHPRRADPTPEGSRSRGAVPERPRRDGRRAPPLSSSTSCVTATTSNAKRCSTQDDIYYCLVSIDYPDAITGGLRRTTDVARSLIERIEGVLYRVGPGEPRAALKEHAKRLEAGSCSADDRAEASARQRH